MPSLLVTLVGTAKTRLQDWEMRESKDTLVKFVRDYSGLCIYTSRHICILVHMYRYVYIYIFVYMYIYIYLFAYLYTYTYVCMFFSLNMRFCICMRDGTLS